MSVCLSANALRKGHVRTHGAVGHYESGREVSAETSADGTSISGAELGEKKCLPFKPQSVQSVVAAGAD